MSLDITRTVRIWSSKMSCCAEKKCNLFFRESFFEHPDASIVLPIHGTVEVPLSCDGHATWDSWRAYDNAVVNQKTITAFWRLQNPKGLKMYIKLVCLCFKSNFHQIDKCSIATPTGAWITDFLNLTDGGSWNQALVAACLWPWWGFSERCQWCRSGLGALGSLAFLLQPLLQEGDSRRFWGRHRLPGTRNIQYHIL